MLYVHGSEGPVRLKYREVTTSDVDPDLDSVGSGFGRIRIHLNPDPEVFSRVQPTKFLGFFL